MGLDPANGRAIIKASKRCWVKVTTEPISWRIAAWRAALLAALMLSLPGCGGEGEDVTDMGSPVELLPTQTIVIASFNIQTFGEAKLEKAEVMNVIVRILALFDIVALQEIRGSENFVLHHLVGMMEAQGFRYDYLSSPPMGSGSHREQYAFVYNPAVVQPVGEPRVYPQTGGEKFLREPFLARFTTANGFDFVLVAIHTSPSLAAAEIGALPHVVDYGRDQFPDEQDFVVLGDFNADCGYYDEAGGECPLRTVEYQWLIADWEDTSLAQGECTYDRIVITAAATGEDYAGNYGVYRFDQELGLSAVVAEAVSDHYPVWAQFHTDLDGD